MQFIPHADVNQYMLHQLEGKDLVNTCQSNRSIHQQCMSDPVLKGKIDEFNHIKRTKKVNKIIHLTHFVNHLYLPTYKNTLSQFYMMAGKSNRDDNDIVLLMIFNDSYNYYVYFYNDELLEESYTSIRFSESSLKTFLYNLLSYQMLIII